MILHCDYCNSDMSETENWKCPNCGAGLKERGVEQKPTFIKEMVVFDGLLYTTANGKVYKYFDENKMELETWIDWYNDYMTRESV